MKISSTLILALFLSIPASYFAQGQALPAVSLKNLDGKVINSSAFENDGKPIIISFWATWCKPCIQELITISEHYEDWQAETGVKLIAISTDDSRNSMRVAPFVDSKGWEYEVYLDENQDFRRAMNVVNVPHTFLLNGNKEIVWQHNSYNPGDEDELYEEVKKLMTDGKIK